MVAGFGLTRLGTTAAASGRAQVRVETVYNRKRSFLWGESSVDVMFHEGASSFAADPTVWHSALAYRLYEYTNVSLHSGTLIFYPATYASLRVRLGLSHKVLNSHLTTAVRISSPLSPTLFPPIPVPDTLCNVIQMYRTGFPIPTCVLNRVPGDPLLVS
jgi:hypothetical protein